MADSNFRGESSATLSDDAYRMPVHTPKYQYLVCDMLTDQLQANLPLTGVTFDRRLSRAGDFRGQWKISNRNQAILADQITKQVGRFTIWVIRDKRLWWGGPLWSAKGSASTRSYDTIDLQGSSFESYPYHRYLDADWPADYPAGTTDIADMPHVIWADMQAWGTPSDIGVQFSITAVPDQVGAVFAQEFLQSDLKTYGDMIQAFTDCDPGCDYTINVYTDASGNRIKELNTGKSFRATETVNRLAISGYRIPSWNFTRDSTNAGTRFRVWGDPQDGNAGEQQRPAPSAMMIADDLITEGWPYIDVAENIGQVPQTQPLYQPVLDSYATSLRDQFSGIKDVVQYEVDLSTSEWHPNLIGKNVLLKFSKQDLWKPGQTSVITPVVASFTPPDRGQPERVQFTIDGADVG
jgi:hypothetical protein